MSEVGLNPLTETLLVNDIVSVFSVKTSYETVVESVGSILEEGNILNLLLLQQTRAGSA